MTLTESEYYRQRAIAERARAEAAAAPNVADIHLELACMYESLVRLDEDARLRRHLAEAMSA